MNGITSSGPPAPFSAIDIVANSLRPDVLIKFEYAKCLSSLGYVPEIWIRSYLDSIRSLNRFVEFAPKKVGPTDFLQEFNDLFFSIKSNGYLPSKLDEPVKMDPDGNLISAAHRTAICAALGLEVAVEASNQQAEKYNYQYLIHGGVSADTLGLSLISKAKISIGIKCIILHGILNENQRNWAKERISKNTDIYYETDLYLTEEALLYLKYINYVLFNHDIADNWFGNLANGFSGLKNHMIKSKGNGKTSFIFLNNVDESSLIKLKEEIREYLGEGKYSVHTNDSYEELLELAYYSCHPETLSILQSKSFKLDLQYAEALRSVNHKVSAATINTEEIILGGSAALHISGIRQSNDIDLYAITPRDSFEFKLENVNVSLSNCSDTFTYRNCKDFIMNPSSMFRFTGFNVLALKELSELKKVRMEYPKDHLDVLLIQEYLSDSLVKSDWKILRRKVLFLSWKVTANYALIRIRFIQFFYNIKTIRRIVYAIRQLRS